MKIDADSIVNIDIGSKWRITTDPYNYILSRKYYKKENGKEYYAVEGYYTTVESVLNAVVDKELKQTEANSLKQILKNLKDIREEIAIACSTINGGKKNAKLHRKAN